MVCRSYKMTAKPAVNVVEGGMAKSSYKMAATPTEHVLGGGGGRGL
jgi:hypothetical protein